ncbi:polysaccharide biosynthesis protein [Halomonas cerina]|uniref:FlaA1/EpsC-like NDP-sugar epimerase n=1 Tax=Halomonas cerina TaxID=447424 RepID=A0A839V9N2_9GAMM|nr:nucleoside-diphosphate sugar epimerase/dehydratase [Halomonas cerina]MBB3189414.1 FlaA1/EpsC-like NDP-sugar epimerase [Halomonas cerina]
MVILSRLFRLPRKTKRLIQLSIDIGLLTSSFALALWLHRESWAMLQDPRTWAGWLVVLPASLAIFTQLGFYRAVIRYMSAKALQSLLIGVSVSAGLLVLISRLLGIDLSAAVGIIYAMLALLSVGGVRYVLRALHLRSMLRYKTRVLIYGAGAAGSQLVSSLRQGAEYAPMAFVDDWRGMHGTYVEGLKVYAPGDLPQLVKNYGIRRILLAIPSATRARRREILKTLEPLSVPVQTLPGMADVVAGRAQVNEVRNVTVEDLLGRDPVPPDAALLDANIRDKVVMVTGAGGSIGAELSRQVLQQRPRQLLLFEICEFSLYRIERELQQYAQDQELAVPIKALLGSVQDRARLETILRTFRVQTIYHAAAYKHVPMVEHNTVQGIRNNVFGTLATAQAAMDCGVETFVLVSTDKAVRPTNVMGTTKRLAELVCQALAEHQASTRFCMVRFGNVLGSSGSVVPLFRRQIAAGGPITVTHPEITRFFMTIPEAAQLVIQAGALGNGGDVFVLDMGEPVKIADLAAQMVRLSGLEVACEAAPNGDIEIVYTGLRPGEKLYEELLIGEKVGATSHSRIMTAMEAYWPWPRLERYLEQLYRATEDEDQVRIRELLQSAPTAYAPRDEIADLAWCGRTPEPPSQVPQAPPLAAPQRRPEPGRPEPGRLEPTPDLAPSHAYLDAVSSSVKG